VSNRRAHVIDCQVNADVVLKHGTVVDASTNTYETDLEFARGTDGRWRLINAEPISKTKGVAGCALSD